MDKTRVVYDFSSSVATKNTSFPVAPGNTCFLAADKKNFIFKKNYGRERKGSWIIGLPDKRVSYNSDFTVVS